MATALTRIVTFGDLPEITKWVRGRPEAERAHGAKRSPEATLMAHQTTALEMMG
jgi:hypothetical protein